MKPKRTDEERGALNREALARAEQNESWANYPAIFEGFTARGIPEQDIIPRENVLTYHAWLAKGRQVRRGEHGVMVQTWIVISNGFDDDEPGKVRRIPRTAYVFHVSQTDEGRG